LKVQRYSFFNLVATWGVGGQHHAPGALPRAKSFGTLFTGGWVGPRAVLGGYRERKFLGLTGVRNQNRRAHSKSLYRTQYPESRNM